MAKFKPANSAGVKKAQLFGKAISHEIRAGIVDAIARDEAGGSTAGLSPSELAPVLFPKKHTKKQRSAQLGLIDHHIKVLLACELVDMINEERVRGAHKHSYRLKPWAKTKWNRIT